MVIDGMSFDLYPALPDPAPGPLPNYLGTIPQGMGDLGDDTSGIDIQQMYANDLGNAIDSYDASYNTALEAPTLQLPNVPLFGSSGVSNNSPSSGGTAFNWNSLLAPLTNATSTILKAQFGQPNLAPGEYVNTRTGVAFQEPTGVPVDTTLGGTGFTLATLLPIVLLGGAAILVINMVKR